MKLEERAVYGFKPVDLGIFSHSAMEQFSKKIRRAPSDMDDSF